MIPEILVFVTKPKNAKLDYLPNQLEPQAVILHVGTNDIETKQADVVLGQLHDTVDAIHLKFPHTKIILSNIAPRTSFQHALDYVNGNINFTYAESSYVTVCRNSNIQRRVQALDGIHLRPPGASVLASNFKKCVAAALKIQIR